MSFERYWHWLCDHCGATAVVQDYGLPAGWVFVKGAKITHRCPACKAGIDPRAVGIPRVVARQ